MHKITNDSASDNGNGQPADNGNGQPAPDLLDQDVARDNRLPIIESEAEATDTIRPGHGGKLIVPREDIDVDLEDGEELDLLSLEAKKIRKPDRREWIILNRESQWVTRLLLHKARPDAIDTEYFYVDKNLRAPIQEELKQVRVFLYYSVKVKSFALWIVHITPDNDWYESLNKLFERPMGFFASNAIRIISDKSNNRYRVKGKQVSLDVAWPMKSTGELLGAALGADRIIDSADHPLYRELIEGVEID